MTQSMNSSAEMNWHDTIPPGYTGRRNSFTNRLSLSIPQTPTSPNQSGMSPKQSPKSPGKSPTTAWMDNYSKKTPDYSLIQSHHYRPPGYGGYIPGSQDSHGKSLGRTFRECLEEQKSKIPESAPIVPERTDKYYKSRLSPKEIQVIESPPSATGGHLPGYGGHVKGYRDVMGKPYSTGTMVRQSTSPSSSNSDAYQTTHSSEFSTGKFYKEETKRDIAALIPGYTGYVPQGTPPGKSKWTTESQCITMGSVPKSPPSISSPSTPTILATENLYRSQEKFHISGYSGHVPFQREAFGMSYPQTTLKANEISAK